MIKEYIKKRLIEYYSGVSEMIEKVYDIFVHHFGEDRVDIPERHSLEEDTTESLERISNKNLLDLLDYIVILSGIVNPEEDLTISQLLDKCLKQDSDIEKVPVTLIEEIFSLLSFDETKDILVHFPEVIVTNENDKSTTLKDLYIKVLVNNDGSIEGYPTINKATYSYAHFINNYVHSHTTSFNLRNSDPYFSEVCIGSGPINNTIASLSVEFDEDLWALYCLELDNYTKVESLSGGPYKYLEKSATIQNNVTLYNSWTSIPNRSLSSLLPDDSSLNSIKAFTRYLINKDILKFGVFSNSFILGLPFTETLLLISNAYIDWYNNVYYEEGKPSISYLKEYRIIKYVKIDNDTVSILNNSIIASENISKFVCRFKGKDIYTSVENPEEVPDEFKIIMLQPQLIKHILDRIIHFLNITYGKEERSYSGKKIILI